MYRAFLKMEARRQKSDSIVDALSAHNRVIISGGPRTGKSTVAVKAGERFGRPVKHGDSLIGKLEWSEASQEVSTWFDAPGDWIVEGVSTPRALRKWLEAHPKEPLSATVVHFREPVQVRSEKQAAMSKGVETVWSEIKPELEKRGAVIIERDG